MPIHKYHILHISQRCWHVLGEVWTSLQRVNVANWTRGWIRLLHICSGTSVMFVHQQKVNHIFNFSESTALPIHLYIVGGGPEKVMDWMHSSRYLHEHTQTLLHLRPPMEKKRRKKTEKWCMCFSERTHGWNSTCLHSCLVFSGWKVFRRERTTSPRWTIYCPSLGILHDPGMGMESGNSWSSELTLAVLSWLPDKTVSGVLKFYTRVFSKKHFSSFSRSGFW